MAKETQSDRLDRIEEKIDKMSEAIIALARAEDKIITFSPAVLWDPDVIADVLSRLFDRSSPLDRLGAFPKTHTARTTVIPAKKNCERPKIAAFAKSTSNRMA